MFWETLCTLWWCVRPRINQRHYYVKWPSSNSVEKKRTPDMLTNHAPWQLSPSGILKHSESPAVQGNGDLSMYKSHVRNFPLWLPERKALFSWELEPGLAIKAASNLMWVTCTVSLWERMQGMECDEQYGWRMTTRQLAGNPASWKLIPDRLWHAGLQNP